MRMSGLWYTSHYILWPGVVLLRISAEFSYFKYLAVYFENFLRQRQFLFFLTGVKVYCHIQPLVALFCRLLKKACRILWK